MAKIGFTTSDGSDLGDLLVPRDIFSEGGLWLWGNNSSGQLGDNSVVNKSSPVQTIAWGSNWKQFDCGSGHTAAIKTDGTLWTWGLNSVGQLGNNTSGAANNKSSPAQTIALGTNWKQVACRELNTAAIKTDGTLWNWGSNLNGQLGDNTFGTANNKSSPIQTITFGNNWKQVACGYLYTAAIKTDGTLWTWGLNTSGQLGNNTSGAANNKSSPVQTITFGTNWKQVSCGRAFAAAIKTDGTLWLWGINSSGQLGDNSTSNKSSPVQTISGGTNWKQVACGSFHATAIKTDGTLWGWGSNLYGGLGDNTTNYTSSPVQTIAFGTNWKQVSGGSNHTAAIKTDGTLWTWGYDGYGQLGDNTITDKSSPVQTVSAGTNWKLVAAFNQTIAAKDDM